MANTDFHFTRWDVHTPQWGKWRTSNAEKADEGGVPIFVDVLYGHAVCR